MRIAKAILAQRISTVVLRLPRIASAFRYQEYR